MLDEPIPGRCGFPKVDRRHCRNYPLKGKGRCKKHGGGSNGAPKGNQRAVKHGMTRSPAVFYQSMSPERAAQLKAFGAPDEPTMDAVPRLIHAVRMQMFVELQERFERGEVDPETYEKGRRIWLTEARKDFSAQTQGRAALARAGLDKVASDKLQNADIRATLDAIKGRGGSGAVLASLPESGNLDEGAGDERPK